ncbi:MAG: hypothetical protein U1E05_09635 [Patescibacteria group bacterium]|nr:hypothetical protein [Patescibacteria group bacterium]
MNRRTIAVVSACLLLVGIQAGCRGLAPPNIGYPGTASDQQARAEKFDPYPENEAGPAVEGGRPREYTKPIPEVDRARHVRPAPSVVNSNWMPWNWGQKY